MATSTRSNAYRGSKVELKVQYYGPDGYAKDANSIPKIQIKDANGTLILASTNTGVLKVSEGLYKYVLDVGTTVEKGLWTDTWTATVSGVNLSDSFNFLVTDQSSAAALGTTTIKLADDVDFDFSQEELTGINTLLKYLKARLRSDGKKPKRDSYGAFVTDGYGELVLEDCNVFTDEILATFLCISLSEFNMTPFFTSYTFSDQIIYKTFAHIIVEGALIVALASQSLIEKGREFTISDGGISYQPATLADHLSTQYNNLMSSHLEKLKFVKNSIRPAPTSFGTFTNLSSGAPAFVRLRHLRSRKII
tara:strand:+ start:1559 stop:2479 length:921 start_codon:yes stop_codon:yes gene_type:complete